jgi:hypothetical protein
MCHLMTLESNNGLKTPCNTRIHYLCLEIFAPQGLLVRIAHDAHPWEPLKQDCELLPSPQVKHTLVPCSAAVISHSLSLSVKPESVPMQSNQSTTSSSEPVFDSRTHFLPALCPVSCSGVAANPEALAGCMGRGAVDELELHSGDVGSLTKTGCEA